jgi:glycosyltransferase involved in cell wall biosynthesis
MLVSVVIPAYNRANVLPRAINSVLAQTYKDFEIIVVDDCSKDNTGEVMKQFSDPRIRYIKHERNKGGNAARNTGIKASEGEFVAFLDSDDEWLPIKLEKQLPAFTKSNVGLVYSGFIFIEESVATQRRYLVNKTEDFRQDLLVTNFVGTASVAVVRKVLLNRINGFDETLRSCQDWDLYLRLSEICEFECVAEFLALYHIDRKGKKQISANPVTTISGHKRIEEKYTDKIRLLPRDKKLQHIDYFLTIYTGACSWRGIALAYEGLKISGDPQYIFCAFKIVIKSIMRKLKLR